MVLPFIISIPLIIMSCILDQSIVSLFLVGIYPGFLVVIGLLVVNYFKVKKYAFHDKNNPSDWDSDLTSTVTMLISNGKWVLMIPIFTVGFLSSGTLTTSETATLVTVYTLLLGKLVYRQLDIKFLTMALQKTLHSFGMIATLTLVGITLSDLITITISQFSLTSLFYDKHLLSLGIADPELKMCIWSFFMVAILVLLGKTLDTITRMFIFTPIFFPIMITLGMSPITFAIIFLIGCQIDSLATHTNRCFAAAKMIVIPIIIWLPLQNWYIF